MYLGHQKPLRLLLADAGADGLLLCVEFEGVVTHLATPATLLESAEGQGCVEDVVAIDPDGSGTHFCGDGVSAIDVASPDSGGETVDAVVGLRNEIVLVLERDGGDDRSENLFLHDLHAVIGVDEHGGLDKVSLVALALAADSSLCAFGESGLEESANAVELLFANERT